MKYPEAAELAGQYSHCVSVTIKGNLLGTRTMKYPVASELAGRYPHYVLVTIKGNLLETRTMKYPVASELGRAVSTLYTSH